MPTGRPKRMKIALTADTQRQLESLPPSRSLPHEVVRRAQIILASAAGDSNTAIARRLKLSLPTIGLWRERFQRQGLAGLSGDARPGRPRSHDDERVAALLTKTLRTRPRHAPPWSVRLVARETGNPKSTVQRYLSLLGVQPHRQVPLEAVPQNPWNLEGRTTKIGGQKTFCNSLRLGIVICPLPSKMTP